MMQLFFDHCKPPEEKQETLSVAVDICAIRHELEITKSDEYKEMKEYSEHSVTHEPTEKTNERSFDSDRPKRTVSSSESDNEVEDNNTENLEHYVQTPGYTEHLATETELFQSAYTNLHRTFYEKNQPIRLGGSYRRMTNAQISSAQRRFFSFRNDS